MTNPPRIQTVVAAAGAGKTTRIVGEIAREILQREPETLVATTFTVKAADELIERTRTRLFADGQAGLAARLLGARFGTINSVCGRIAGEFALELGRSPRAEVIPEEQAGRIFAISAEAAIEAHAQTLNRLSGLLGMDDARTSEEEERKDWRFHVRRIIELARANGIAAEELPVSAVQSANAFLPLLPTASSEAETHLDGALKAALLKARMLLDGAVSSKARDHLDLIRRTASLMERGHPLGWPDWVRLSKVSCAPTKDPRDLVAAFDEVASAASRHPEHPRLARDCVDFIEEIFACAGDAMTAYQRYKSERGLLDFTDQEALALQVLRDPALRDLVAERIGRIFVDEFQDSSPLQIAVFTALAELADASTWVGDPKQAIYGFRNADSRLTLAAFKGAAEAGQTSQEALSRSYRSRRGIIEFVNSAFGPAFAAMGLEGGAHAFSDTARSEGDFDRGPLSLWRLTGKKIEDRYADLATAIFEALEEPGGWRVEDRVTGKLRNLEAGDIAVLCRTNPDVEKLARALTERGIRVAVARGDLSGEPHIQLVMAACRWIADGDDRLALAELARLLAPTPDADDWLQALMAEDGAGDAALRQAAAVTEALAALSAARLSLTPSEILDRVIAIPVIRRRIEDLGELRARLDDLEALRGFARTYEEGCAGLGAPATLSGLILAFLASPPRRPSSLQPDAVKLLTYHGSKGLEWPFVILTGLDRAPKARLFEPVAEAHGDLDWRNPLAGRWIRFWPWPYGQQGKDSVLDIQARESAVGQAALASAREEETRLLYVGMTRARDHLVLAVAPKGKLSWLGVLDTDGQAHIALPEAMDNVILAGQSAHPVHVMECCASEPGTQNAGACDHVSLDLPLAPFRPLRRRPSQDSEAQRLMQVVETIPIGPRLALGAGADMQKVGEAVHGLLALDRSRLTGARQLELAQGLLERWGVRQLKASDLLAACEAFEATLARLWPEARLHREIPVSARLGNQVVEGRIDLLIEHASGYCVVDHKSFPGASDSWNAKALSHGPQLALYAQAVTAATGRPCTGLFIHMPIAGVLLSLSSQAGGSGTAGTP